MNEIGGYFQLELNSGNGYHRNAINLNLGRTAFEYILRARGYKKVYLSYYSCDVILEPIRKLNLEFEFYHINKRLEPVFDYDRIGKNETFLYINYFSIKNKFIENLANRCTNLIIDNSQAFFEMPIAGIDTFYSARKFFGVPDGAYLYSEKSLNTKLSRDVSVPRFKHLIKRIDGSAEEGYPDFQANEVAFKGQPIKEMSALTKVILCNIDYNKAIKARKQNFYFLNEHLCKSNKIEIPFEKDFVPMVYPYLISNGEKLKQMLIAEGVFIATYWPNILEWCNENQLEYSLAKQIIPLPVDQRYGFKEMKKILLLISSYHQ